MRYKLFDETFTISGICLVAVGTIVDGITLNPIILGVINSSGVVVAGIGKKKITREKLKWVESHLRRMKKFSLNRVQLCEETPLTNKSLSIEWN